jgi:hypothetical protein
MAKLIAWFALNGASVIGLIQSVLKFLKEVLTLIVNILFPIIPDGKFEIIVLKVRDIVNKADAFVENIKAKLIK